MGNLEKIIRIILVIVLIISIIICCISLVIFIKTPKIESEYQQVVSTDNPQENIEWNMIWDFNNHIEEYVEIYEDEIKYVNEMLGYSFWLPKCWEGNFKVEEYEGQISVRFYGESEEGKGIYKGRYTGLTLFSVVYNADDHVGEDGYGDFTFLGNIDGSKYYRITDADCGLCALYDEVNDYEKGVSKYQNERDLAFTRRFPIFYHIFAVARQNFFTILKNGFTSPKPP